MSYLERKKWPNKKWLDGVYEPIDKFLRIKGFEIPK